MTPYPAPLDARHGHLWTATDGTGLHAPFGELARDPDTEKVCCHLCGRWFTLLGAHVRVHGHASARLRHNPVSSRDQLLQEHGAADLEALLRTRYAQGDSLDALARATGLGRARLREASVPMRPTGVNTDAGRRSRARTADAQAAERLGVDDLGGWLRERHEDGWPLTRLAAAVGHSTHWVR